MIDYNIANLKNQLELNKNKVILFGAGDIGELSNYSLNKLDSTFIKKLKR